MLRDEKQWIRAWIDYRGAPNAARYHHALPLVLGDLELALSARLIGSTYGDTALVCQTLNGTRLTHRQLPITIRSHSVAMRAVGGMSAAVAHDPGLLLVFEIAVHAGHP